MVAQFVDIGDIVEHRCLNYLFIRTKEALFYSPTTHKKNKKQNIIMICLFLFQFSNVLSSAALFSGLCENKTLADYITPPGVISPIAADLSKVMCIHPEAFLQILMNQTKSEQLQKQVGLFFVYKNLDV